MRYIILSYSMPNLKTSTADLHVLCKPKSNVGCDVWFHTNDIMSVYEPLSFNTREEADDYIKNVYSNLQCISYGIDYDL